MYGVVTKYVLKPKLSLARASSAPHPSRARSFDAFTPRELLRPHPPDQHYGSVLDERGSSHGPVVPVEIHIPTSQRPDLRRTRSEFPQSKATLFAYQREDELEKGEQDADESKYAPNVPDESTPMMGFISATPSNDFLPILLTMLACLGSFAFGFHIGFSSPFEDAVLQTSKLPQQQIDLMFSLISIGAIAGALSSGPISASFGRRTSIVASTLPYVLGALLMVWAGRDLVFLCAGRLLIGVGVGSSSVLVPLYVAEIAPPARRGSLGSASSFFMSAGLVLVNAAGIPAVSNPQLWKLVLLASLIPIVLMSVVMQFYAVETPRYLMSVDDVEGAKAALRRLRGDGWDVDGEINEMMDTEEVGLGSVKHSKEALRRWAEQYGKYFEPDAMMPRSGSWQSPNGYQTEEDEEEDLQQLGEEQEEVEDLEAEQNDKDAEMVDATIDRATANNGKGTSVRQSGAVTQLRSVASSPTLKSSLAKSKRSSSANSTTELNTSPSSATSTDTSTTALSPSGPITLPEAPRDKKSVRVTLPGNSYPEPAEPDSVPKAAPHLHIPPNAHSQKAPGRSPTLLHAAHQVNSSAHNLLARARSVARRAFPSAPVLPSTSTDDEPTGWGVYLQRKHLVPLLLGISLQCLQQWSGINAFMFHLKSMLTDKGDDAAEQQSSQDQNDANARTALYGAIGVSTLQLVMGGLAMVMMEKAGRRVWLLASSFGMSISAVLLSYAYYSNASNNLRILLVMTYVASFATGMGPMPWLVCSEIFPAAIRSSAVSMATTANWANAFLVTASYPLLEAALGEWGVYAMYAAIIVIGMVYVALCLPETAGKSLEEIEDMFDTSIDKEGDRANGKAGGQNDRW